MDFIFQLGSQLDLVPYGTSIASTDSNKKRYTSAIHDVIDSQTLIITNPMEQSRLVPLHVGERYECYIFLDNRVYTCGIQIDENQKDGHMHTVRVSIITEVSKFERRRFYRLDASIDMRYVVVNRKNVETLCTAIKEKQLLSYPDYAAGVTMDISGGGLRFYCEEGIGIGRRILIHLLANLGDEIRPYVFLGEILSCASKEGARGYYEHRVQFEALDPENREEFVKFIFEKERELLRASR